MRIGYSFWGFLGPGITDTPDGGRSHRQVLVDGLRSRGHDIVFLQPDRDHLEAGAEYSHHYRWDAGLPDVDVLFLEWRWPIAGRNTTRCGTPGHTCDLHRQTQLLEHYTTGDRAFTIIWDKDRHLPINDPLRRHGNVAVAEAAMRPTPGAWPLLFPVADDVLNAADPSALASLHRDLPLVYIAQRRWRYRGGQHYDVGVFDRITWSFVRYIIGYRASMRPRVDALVTEHGTHLDVIALTSRRAANRFVRRHQTPSA